MIDISKLPGYGGKAPAKRADSGMGSGFAIVRKWTDPDYERLITEEQAIFSKLKLAGHEAAGETVHQAALMNLLKLGVKPYGMAYGYNAFMRATGNKRLWQALMASVAGTFTNALSALGVGDSTTAVTVTQTNLQGAVNNTNRKRLGMVATYPQINGSPNDNQIVFRTDFPTGNAEFAWNEFATFDNVTDASGDMFNRGLFSPSPGTKGAGVTWTLTETLTNT